MERFKRIIDERNPCEDARVQKMADSLIEKITNSIGIEQVIPYWQNIFKNVLADVDFMDHEECPEIFYEFRFFCSQPVEITLQDESFEEMIQIASTSVGTLAARKKGRYKFARPFLSFLPKSTEFVVKIGIKKKLSKDQST